MIIGIYGKVQSENDIIGKIIQYLSVLKVDDVDWNICTFKHLVDPITEQSVRLIDHYNKAITDWSLHNSKWKIVKFIDAPKSIVCILTGCTREQLEDEGFKNSKLPDEWIRYGYADGFIKTYTSDNPMGEPIMNNKQCSKERYEQELTINWQTAYKTHLTYGELLQGLDIDLLRNRLHEHVWVYALFSKYIAEVPYPAFKKMVGDITRKDKEYPNWIITDVRFPNEVKAIKDRGGIIIRGSDYTPDNNGTIEDLIKQVKEVLIKMKLI